VEERSDRFTAIEDRFAGYELYDQAGEKIGKVDDLFVDEQDNPEYIGVKMGFLATSSTLIPMAIVTVDESAGRLVTSAEKEKVKSGPTFDDDREITPEYENEVHSYYGLQCSESTQTTGETTDEDELRVQRSEEELRAGTREREAGEVGVRKTVRTERERLEVPTRREEVTVDRVPVDSETSEADIGEEEIRVPVTEEEAAVEKRPVAKEEVRIRKDVVEGTETVEEDVRREEVEVDDDTEPGTR
jgi:uncharacterized protein (TIGR02271 family)